MTLSNVVLSQVFYNCGCMAWCTWCMTFRVFCRFPEFSLSVAIFSLFWEHQPPSYFWILSSVCSTREVSELYLGGCLSATAWKFMMLSQDNGKAHLFFTCKGLFSFVNRYSVSGKLLNFGLFQVIALICPLLNSTVPRNRNPNVFFKWMKESGVILLQTWREIRLNYIAWIY